jgi:hypothetical protein
MALFNHGLLGKSRYKNKLNKTLNLETNLEQILFEMPESQLEFTLKLEKVRPLAIDVGTLSLQNLLKTLSENN